MSEQRLPDGWQWIRLGDFAAKIGSGATPRGGTASYIAEGVPLIRSQNVHMNRFEYKGLAFISELQDRQMLSSRVQQNDILLNITGASIGRVCIVPEAICPANVNQHVSIIRTNESIIPRFLAYYLSSPDFQKFIMDSEAGATRQALTKSQIESFQIPLPLISEQQRIVAIIEEQMADIDAARAAVEGELEAAEALTASYLREVFESDEAQAWEYSTIDEVSNLVRGSSPRPKGDPLYYGGPIPRLMVEDLTRDGFFVTPRIDSLTEEGAKQSRFMKAGSVVMVVSGNPGLPAILNVDACIHDGFVGFRDLRNDIMPSFFMFYLKHVQVENSKQATGAIWQNLTTDQIKSWTVPLPELSEQSTIVEALLNISTQVEQLKITLIQKQILANAMSSAVLRHAFSGEL